MKFLIRLLKVLVGLLLLLWIVYSLGPKPEYPELESFIPEFDLPLDQLDAYLAEKESKIVNLKPNNHSRIIWADSIRKTDHCLLYLHGFSASPMEGDPTHEQFAQRYGCNLYIPRLAQHGIKDKDIFETLTPKELVDSARDAVAVARLLGDTIILMSCSTGSTLGTYLDAENPGLFKGHIMYSPNFDLADSRTGLLTKNWGLQLARQLIGERRHVPGMKDSPKAQYTTSLYKVEGLVCLKSLVQSTMTPATYQKVKTPYMVAYYYKDETAKDNIISIDAIKAFHQNTSTVAQQKQLLALPGVGTHVIPSDLYCKDLEAVNSVSYSFAEKVLGLQPAQLN